MNLDITSVASYLPSSMEDNNAAFAGTTSNHVPPILTPIQEAALRAQHDEMQMKDAETRNVIWATDDLTDQDAEGNDDDEYVRRVDGSGYDKIVDIMKPIGIRNWEGVIEPIVEKGAGASRREGVMDVEVDAIWGAERRYCLEVSQRLSPTVWPNW